MNRAKRRKTCSTCSPTTSYKDCFALSRWFMEIELAARWTFRPFGHLSQPHNRAKLFIFFSRTSLRRAMATYCTQNQIGIVTNLRDFRLSLNDIQSRGAFSFFWLGKSRNSQELALSTLSPGSPRADRFSFNLQQKKGREKFIPPQFSLFSILIFPTPLDAQREL